MIASFWLLTLSTAGALPAAPAPRGKPPRPLVCMGHTTFVVSVSVSPDGKRVASGSDDQTLRLWDAADGKLLRTVKGNDPPARGGWVGAVTFAPDGRTLAAWVAPRGLQFYDAAPAKPAVRRPPPGAGGYGIAISPDGRRLADASNDGVRVWDVATGRKLHHFRFDRRSIGRAWRVAFAPDGKHLAAALHWFGGDDGFDSPKVRVWELGTGKEVFAAWEGWHANAIAFSPDGKLLAACGGNDGRLDVYDWAKKKRLFRLQSDKHVAFCLAFAADGKTLYTGGNDPEVKLWDVLTGTAAGKLAGHTDQVADLALSKDGRVLATAGRDKRVLIWHLGANGR